uniref:alkaline phosphatase-like n=1 Tax=Styela clava TaxID=7725 RepID=UPI001939A462|nr:alkaline phosphatase-like [Styela clava]
MIFKTPCWVFVVIFLHGAAGQGPLPRKEFNADYWNNMGAADVEETVTKFNNLNTNKAKNVILFIGDGMSLSTVVAGRILKGQRERRNAHGEEAFTSLDRMPHNGLLKTYSVDHQTPDSASTATAYLCGVKTRSSMLGVSARVQPGNCNAAKRNGVASVLENAAMAGRSTGIVTTTRVQHATPAGAYAKVPSRSWYSDAYMSATVKRQGCKDIATQLVDMGRKINVVLGGGRVHMRPVGYPDEEYSSPGSRGDRRDGKNLIEEWLENKIGSSAKYVWNKEQFDDVDPDETDYLMGLFSPFEMQFSLERKSDPAGEPSLAEMTEKAIKILRKNDNGYFLLVESGMLDKAHHKSLAHYALEEFMELEKAVKVAQDLTSDSDTLIIATADHGHVFTIGGGTAKRGNPILGLAPSNKRPAKALDGKFYTTSGYANGAGGFSPRGRPNVLRQNAADKGHKFQSAIPLHAESHSSEDVVAFSSGPMSHMITGVHEQNYVAHMINFAACTGPYESGINPHCIVKNPEKSKRRRFDDPNVDFPTPWEDPSAEL